MIVKGKRIDLRVLAHEDAPSLSHHANDPEVAMFTKIPHPYGEQDALDFIAHAQQQLRCMQGLKLAIVLKQSNEVIGVISLCDIDYQHKKAEIAYWLGKRYWGRNIMKEAISLMLTHGFYDLGLNKIYAVVMHPNSASVKLIEKCGFSYEGRMRQHVFKRGQWLDHLMYSLLREEFINNNN